MQGRQTSQQRKPSLAIEDVDFLAREEMRGLRLALEFERAELGLQDQGIKSTVVVFGSSRVRPGSQSFKGPGKLKASKRAANKSARSAAASSHADWYEMARKFAQIASERGGALNPVAGLRENVIITGGGPGIMEAANRGAADVGAPSIGLNIELPTEQAPNKYITPELCFHFHYFAVRKMHFAMRANALAVFPGGFGTLDELFEILTLKQTRKAGGMPVILFCRDYWERVVDFAALADLGVVGLEDLELFEIVDSAEAGWTAMMERGLAVSTPLREA